MTMSLENPEKASSTVRMPDSTRIASRISVAMSTEIHSKAKTRTMATSRARTRKIDSVMRPSRGGKLISLDNPAASPYSSRGEKRWIS